MKKYITILAVLTLTIIGCGPREIAEETTTACIPENLQVDVKDGAMDVIWENSCENLISGYNIYISEDKNQAEANPYNNGPFPGDTNPEDGKEIYEAKQLQNGKKYYVSVKIINADQTLSKPSEQILAVCGPREEIELSIRFKSDNDGYSFKDNNYVRADNVDNDLYFWSKDNVDYISSPHKLDGFLKNNKLSKISFTGEFAELKVKINSVKKGKQTDRLEIKENDWILLETADKKHALINILGFTGSGEERKISMFIAYSPIAGEMIF